MQRQLRISLSLLISMAATASSHCNVAKDIQIIFWDETQLDGISEDMILFLKHSLSALCSTLWWNLPGNRRMWLKRLTETGIR
jgi:hypothetical protein